MSLDEGDSHLFFFLVCVKLASMLPRSLEELSSVDIKIGFVDGYLIGAVGDILISISIISGFPLRPGLNRGTRHHPGMILSLVFLQHRYSCETNSRAHVAVRKWAKERFRVVHLVCLLSSLYIRGCESAELSTVNRQHLKFLMPVRLLMVPRYNRKISALSEVNFVRRGVPIGLVIDSI
jgi:hypothetical protein